MFTCVIINSRRSWLYSFEILFLFLLFCRLEEEMARSVGLGDPCVCKNIVSSQYRIYETKCGRILGKQCISCETEWLMKEYLPGDLEDTTDSLFRRDTYKLDPIEAAKILLSGTKIEFNNFDSLFPGNHIAWFRKKLHVPLYFHHAIVVEVNDFGMYVIHWTKTNNSNNKIQIVKEFLSTDKLMFDSSDPMYLLDYPGEIEKANDMNLVLARAFSRHGDTKYGLVEDNCECFATFCKTGSHMSLQATVLRELRCITTDYLPRAISTGVELELGAAIIVLIPEVVHFVTDMRKFHLKRKNGEQTRIEFVEKTTARSVELFVIAGATVGTLYLYGPIGSAIGYTAGKFIGPRLGDLIGHGISQTFRDDRAITHICDLESGDHVVLNCGDCLPDFRHLHPRCHAIVVKHNGSNRIKVIRNVRNRGVVEEWIHFTQPLFKVLYEQEECEDSEEVIRYARQKQSEDYRYFLPVYNCKTFAKECKARRHWYNSITLTQGITTFCSSILHL